MIEPRYDVLSVCFGSESVAFYVFLLLSIATLQGTTTSPISRVNLWIDIENRVLFLGCRRMPLVFAVDVEMGQILG